MCVFLFIFRSKHVFGLHFLLCIQKLDNWFKVISQQSLIFLSRANSSWIFSRFVTHYLRRKNNKHFWHGTLITQNKISYWTFKTCRVLFCVVYDDTIVENQRKWNYLKDVKVSRQVAMFDNVQSVTGLWRWTCVWYTVYHSVVS